MAGGVHDEEMHEDSKLNVGRMADYIKHLNSMLNPED